MACIGKGGLYFTEAQRNVVCSGNRLYLRSFWHDGTDATICAKHRLVFEKTHTINELKKSYLWGKIFEAQTKGTSQ